MNNTYQVHKATYQALSEGTNSFQFLSITNGVVQIPVVITRITDNSDSLTVKIETVYQPLQGMPNEIILKEGYMDIMVEPIMDESDIRKYLVHYLQTKLKLGGEFQHDNALLQAFIHTFNK